MEHGGSGSMPRTKGSWSPEEDRRLVRLVNEHGEGSWSSIARHFPGRIGKQCRERWHNQLRPDIKRDAWDEEEEKLLIEAHQKLGNKWSDIAKLIPGRTENSVKNHWNATMRRKEPDGIDGRPLTILKQYMKSITAGGRNRNGKRSAKKDKRGFGTGNAAKRLRQEEEHGEEIFNGGILPLPLPIALPAPAPLASTTAAQSINPMRRFSSPEFRLAGTSLPAASIAATGAASTGFRLGSAGTQVPNLLPLPAASQNQPFTASEVDQLLEWLVHANEPKTAAGNGSGDSGVAADPSLAAREALPNIPPLFGANMHGISGLMPLRDVFHTPESPLLASPLLSPTKALDFGGNGSSLITGTHTMLDNTLTNAINDELSALAGRPSSFRDRRTSVSAAALPQVQAQEEQGIAKTNYSYSTMVPAAGASLQSVPVGDTFVSPLPAKSQKPATQTGPQTAEIRRTRRSAASLFSPNSDASPTC